MAKFKCPNCGAEPEKHGRGGLKTCGDRDTRRCQGLICECEDFDNPDFDAEDHGETEEHPCENAVCYHCDWSGRMPVLAFDPKKLVGWAKEAWKAGWRPPIGWKPKKERKT